MKKMRLHYLLTLAIIFVLAVAACTPASPTATSVPPTDVPEVVEEATEEVAEEPTEEVVEEATEEVAEVAEEATEEATEEMAEEPTTVAMAEEPTEEATEEMAEEPTEEATEEMAEEPTEEPTTVAMAEEPTEEATVEATELPTEEATEEMAEEPTEEAEMEATEEGTVDTTGTVMVSAGDEIVVGLATILSGEGLVPLGSDIQRGVELALAARPTVTVDGTEFSIVLDVQDDQCSAEGGQAVANRFASDGRVVAVIGPTCSSACRPAGPIFDAAGYTSISSSCTAQDLTAPDTGFESFNRTTANDNLQGEVAAEFIYNELGITQIATIHDGSAYGEGLVGVLTETFTELGGEVVYADAVNVGDTDFRNLLDNVADADPGLIYFGGFPAEAARLAEQRADAGLEDVPLMGADGINTPEFVNLAGDAAEGTYASSPVAASSEAYDAFVAEYEEVYGTEPTAAFHAYAYDAAIMVLDAIESVGEIDENGDLVIDRAALRDYIRSYAASGLSGELACDGTGDCATGGIGFFQVTDGAFERIGDTAADETAEEAEVEAEATEEAEAEATEEATEEA